MNKIKTSNNVDINKNIFNELKNPIRKGYTEYDTGPKFDKHGKIITYSILGD